MFHRPFASLKMSLQRDVITPSSSNPFKLIHTEVYCLSLSAASDGCISPHIVISSSGRSPRTRDTVEHEAHQLVHWFFNFKAIERNSSPSRGSIEILFHCVMVLLSHLLPFCGHNSWVWPLSPTVLFRTSIGPQRQSPTDGKDIVTSSSLKGRLKRIITRLQGNKRWELVLNDVLIFGMKFLTAQR